MECKNCMANLANLANVQEATIEPAQCGVTYRITCAICGAETPGFESVHAFFYRLEDEVDADYEVREKGIEQAVMAAVAAGVNMGMNLRGG